MASSQPVDIDPIDRDEIEEEDDKLDDNLMNELDRRVDELRRFNATLESSCDKNVGYDITIDKLRLKKIL